MAEKRYTYLFPQTCILLTSLGLCLCAAAEILLAVISWNNQLKGYYFMSGFWCGGSIFVTGVLGIISSCARILPVVKTFLIFCIFGIVVSLALIALSVVGLHDNNTFYRVDKENTFLDMVYHGGLLGIGVLQLMLCIVCNAVCLCYIFASKSDIDTPKDVPRRRLSSTESKLPLIEKQKARNSQNLNEGDQSTEFGMKQEHQSSTGNITRNTRHSTFSTFGRGSRYQDIPVDPAADTADRSSSHSQNYLLEDECHYAHISLFHHPLPIEHDEQLPPYRRVDPNSRGSRKAKNSQLRRTNSMPAFPEKRINKDRQLSLQNRSGVGRNSAHRSSEAQERFSKGHRRSKEQQSQNTKGSIRHSRSADLLELEGQISYSQRTSRQKHAKTDNGSSRILNDGTIVKLRASSLRADKARKLHRKRKAMSAEFTVSKENITIQDEPTLQRTSSIDGSNSGLFASNRIVPTKFSLRRPVRKVGMPAVNCAIPVKPLSSPPPLISPPPKPPRTFMGKNRGSRPNSIETSPKIEDQIFVFPSIKKGSSNDMSQMTLGPTDGSVKNETRPSQEVKLETGPVLKSPKTIKLEGKSEKSNESQSTENRNESVSETEFKSVMELPTSPIIKCPVLTAPKVAVSVEPKQATDSHKPNTNADMPNEKAEKTLVKSSDDTVTLRTGPIVRPVNVDTNGYSLRPKTDLGTSDIAKQEYNRQEPRVQSLNIGTVREIPRPNNQDTAPSLILGQNSNLSTTKVHNNESVKNNSTVNQNGARPKTIFLNYSNRQAPLSSNNDTQNMTSTSPTSAKNVKQPKTYSSWYMYDRPSPTVKLPTSPVDSGPLSPSGKQPKTYSSWYGFNRPSPSIKPSNVPVYSRPIKPKATASTTSQNRQNVSSTSQHRQSDPPSTIQNRQSDPLSAFQNRKSAPPSASQNRQSAPPSAFQNRQSGPSSAFQNRQSAPSSASQNRQSDPANTSQNRESAPANTSQNRNNVSLPESLDQENNENGVTMRQHNSRSTNRSSADRDSLYAKLL